MIVREQSIFLLAIREYVSFHGYEWHLSGTLDSHKNHFKTFMDEIGRYETHITKKPDEKKEGFIRNFVPPRAKTQIFVYPDEVEGIIRWVLLSKKQLPVPKKYGVMQRVDDPSKCLVFNNLRLGPVEVDGKDGEKKTLYVWHLNPIWIKKLAKKISTAANKKSPLLVKYHLDNIRSYPMVPNIQKDFGTLLYLVDKAFTKCGFEYDLRSEFDFRMTNSFYSASINIIKPRDLLKICKRSAITYRRKREQFLNPDLKNKTPEERKFLLLRKSNYQRFLAKLEKEKRLKQEEEERQRELHRQQVQAKKEAKLAKKLEESIDKILEMHDCDL